ncbi:hypothetical protein AYO41_02980 [Verrucomicrobia bacterium SCGC AG-212-E04]|nr:hypothetical protein AYO41_02980 [Verrucomicrobia bacterium SCGC AG-212-E04]
MPEPVTMERRLAERVAPAGRPVMYQAWENLLFLHWKWDPAEIQRTLPPGLTLDVHDGAAWLGVVPFFMRAIRPALLPPVPWLSYFLELNVRTYVCDEDGRPGVWFYSLDCNRSIAVWLARARFHLPYEHAAMHAARGGGVVDYHSRRRGAQGMSHFAYRAAAEPAEAAPGSLDFFLVERYRLFAAARGVIRSGRVHHAPYLVAPATVEACSTDLILLNGFSDPARPADHAMVSPGVRVGVYALGAE